jgi:hypothetical protein
MKTDPGARWSAAGLIVALGLVGCSRPVITERPVNKAEADLGIIASAYAQASDRLGRPPRNVAEIMPFLKQAGNPDEILRSPNDNQPYIIIWDVNLDQITGEPPILAYEKQGRDGKRYVINVEKVVTALTDREFAKAPFARGHKPGP